MPTHYSFEQLVAIMKKLRAPGGCPWDAEQTHESLTRYLLEETYEVIEAIDEQSPDHLKEELGDLLLQPVFHAAIAEEAGNFTISDVINTLCDKLIRRHPHVFGDLEIHTSSQQTENWEKIKRQEKGAERPSALSGVPDHLPALLKAHKIGEKAARVGFDWEHASQVHAKVLEELEEFEEAWATGNNERMSDELGDLLFAITNLARYLSLDSEDALRKTITRFQKRFSFVEAQCEQQGISLQKASLAVMEEFWNGAKTAEKMGQL